jgi:hypothetical protein
MTEAQLTLRRLKAEAKRFANALAGKPIVALYGMDNGKLVGSYIEGQFNQSWMH